MSSIMPTYNRLPLSFVRGHGAWLYEANDTAYLDALTGIAVTGLGHCHPAVSRAIADQASQLVHCSNIYHIPVQEALAERLCAATGMESVFFCNSGAEANEAAIKLARLYGHQKGVESPVIIVLEHAFHGRTLAALTATGNAAIQTGFGPLVPGFVRIPVNDIGALDRTIQDHPNIVAILAEPVQGEGGVRRLEDAFVHALRDRCTTHNLLLMFDEVQSGNGRTGSYFAYQQLGFEPDVVTTAKGLGNGMPIGACLAKNAAAKVLSAGNHGSTYGGNPLACAAANAVVNTIEEQALAARAPIIRSLILDSMLSALRNHNPIEAITGQGLMIGLAMPDACPEIVTLAVKNQLLLNVTSSKVIRLLPALTLSDDEAVLIGERLAATIDHYTQRDAG